MQAVMPDDMLVPALHTPTGLRNVLTQCCQCCARQNLRSYPPGAMAMDNSRTMTPTHTLHHTCSRSGQTLTRKLQAQPYKAPMHRVAPHTKETKRFHGSPNLRCPFHAAPSNIHRTSTQHISDINRTSTEHLLIIRRTSIEHLSNINQSSTEHPPNIYRTSTEHPPNIYRT